MARRQASPTQPAGAAGSAQHVSPADMLSRGDSHRALLRRPLSLKIVPQIKSNQIPEPPLPYPPSQTSPPKGASGRQLVWGVVGLQNRAPPPPPSWARLQTCVANVEEVRGNVLGGKGKEVDCDEAKIGLKQKGTRAHKKIVQGDVLGALERGGFLVLHNYSKFKKARDWERRVGPLGGGGVMVSMLFALCTSKGAPISLPMVPGSMSRFSNILGSVMTTWITTLMSIPRMLMSKVKSAASRHHRWAAGNT